LGMLLYGAPSSLLYVFCVLLGIYGTIYVGVDIFRLCGLDLSYQGDETMKLVQPKLV